MTTAARLVMFLLISSGMISCGPAAPAPSAGEAAGEPRRIVAFSPAIAVILRDIGLEDEIVGKHAYDLVLGDSVPPVGDLLGIDYEALLATEPTLVLTQFQSAGVPERLLELAERRGFEVRDYPLLSIDDVVRTADDLYMDLVYDPGDGPGSSPTGTFVDPDTWLDRRLPGERIGQSLRDRGPASARAGRVLLLGSLDPPSAMGPGSFHHDMLVRIGGRPAIEDGAAWIELDAEDVVRLAPDAIVIFTPRAPRDADRFGEPVPLAWGDVEARLGRLASRDIPAVRDRRVAMIDHPLGLLPSTALGDIADQLAAILARWGEDGQAPADSGNDAP